MGFSGHTTVPPLYFFSGFSDDTTVIVVPVPEDDGAHHGAVRGHNRPKHWWEEDRFYLPPHTPEKRPATEEPLPHEAALADARQELAEARRVKAATKAELRSLSSRMGQLTRATKAVERKIELAENVADVSEQYRALGDRLSGFVNDLSILQERRRKRQRDDEEVIVHLLLQLD